MFQYSDRFEVETPVRKRKGPFILSEQSLFRPEVVRHHARLIQRYEPLSKAKKLLLLPEEQTAPFRERSTTSPPIAVWERLRDGDVCSYSLSYAIVPLALIDVYPLSQTEASLMPTPAAIKYARQRIADYIKKFSYSSCLIIGCAPWHEQLAAGLRQKFKGRVKFRFIEEKELDKPAIQRILRAFK
jgi:predicted RNA-binding protein